VSWSEGFVLHQRTAVRGLLVLASCLFAAAAARAQETRDHELPDLEEEVGVLDYLKLRLTLADRFVGKSDFGAFEASSNQPEGRLRIEMPVAKNVGIRLMGTGRGLLYDLDGTTSDFLPGATFDEFYNANLRLQGAYLFDEDWTLFSDQERWALIVQGGAGWSWEDGSDPNDGLRGGGSVVAGYRLGDTLELAAGISLGSRFLKGGVGVFPLIEFDWRINKDWKLKSYGVGLQLERILGENLSLFARARFEGTTYRLDDRGGSVGKGTLRARQVPAGLGIQWRIARFLRIRLIAGAIAYNQLRVKNQATDTIATVTGTPAPYASLRIDLRN
jgi:hypothetical protein